MSIEIDEIIDALEKPLRFVSRNNFSNLHKVKALDRLVGDLTLKALSLPLAAKQIRGFESLRDSFSGYDGLSERERKDAIRKSLDIVGALKNHESPKAARKPVRERAASSGKSSEAPAASSPAAGATSSPDTREPSQVPIQYIKGVGPRIAGILQKKEIGTVEDALYYFPRTYEDRRTVKSISQIRPGKRETIMGKILLAGRVRTRHKSLYQVSVSDGTGIVVLVWFQFNEKYLRNAYKKGASVILTGDVSVGYRDALQIVHPRPEDIEVIEEGEDIDEDHVHFNLPSVIPPGLKRKRGVIDLSAAVSRAHFPMSDENMVELSDRDSVYASPPHKTLSYYEFFLMELGLALKKRDIAGLDGISFSPTGELTGKLISALPFRLTSAQERVVTEIEHDMRSARPMNRLLQGDVGSGKTVVSLLSMLKAVESGYQAVLMAPTEILAEQHLSSVLGYVKGMGLRVVFLKSGLGRGEKNAYYKAISSGEAQIAVGTHALLQEKVDFRNLGFVVIDEQHRFGVMQRASLMGKGRNPDVLVMTATPIPRTLALTVYGDLDISVLDELPPGRKEIRTRVYYDQKGSRERAYETVRKELGKGRQAYVVYPMIEESENPDFRDLKYATRMAEELKNDIFPEFRVGLLHGRMKTEEKEAVMKRFISRHIDILVSTTVIEVGVDVPNATVMVVENAERFGLTQLHQLRGRIGRGGHESYCILISSFRRSEDAEKRLSIMEETSDGFRIAEADLAIRGPGDFLGTKQSGLPQFRFAELMRDARILGEAREDAFRIVKEDPRLERYPGLMSEVVKRYGRVFELGGIS
jgi:ATP-dependent DNA helicase RecG